MVGSCGQSALAVSAPVGATVISRASGGTVAVWGVASDTLRMLPDRRQVRSSVAGWESMARMRAAVQRVLSADVSVGVGGAGR